MCVPCPAVPARWYHTIVLSSRYSAAVARSFSFPWCRFTTPPALSPVSQIYITIFRLFSNGDSMGLQSKIGCTALTMQAWKAHPCITVVRAAILHLKNRRLGRATAPNAQKKPLFLLFFGLCTRLKGAALASARWSAPASLGMPRVPWNHPRDFWVRGI